MSIIFNLLVCALLLAALWGAIAARRRPAYTFADWQRASARICRAMRRLHSARYPASGSGSTFQRRTCHLLLQDVLANTGFVVNLVNDGYAAPLNPLQHPEIIYTGDVLSQAVRLRIYLHRMRLQLFCWPVARDAHRYAIAAAESYACLCV